VLTRRAPSLEMNCLRVGILSAGRTERAIGDCATNLQQEIRAISRSAHLLGFTHPAVHQEIGCSFSDRGANSQSGTMPFSVIDHSCSGRPDIRPKPARRPIIFVTVQWTFGYPVHVGHDARQRGNDQCFSRHRWLCHSKCARRAPWCMNRPEVVGATPLAQGSIACRPVRHPVSLPRNVVPASGVGFERHGRASDVRELEIASYPTRPQAPTNRSVQQGRSTGVFAPPQIPGVLAQGA
jgi:hypothetical protein